MLLVNTTHPELRIYNPATGGYAEFHGGKLEIDEGDPDYAVAMAEAARNPFISIMTNMTTCPFCGEVFSGKIAAAQLGQHKKASHFERWVADKQAENEAAIQTEIKARAGYACDVCQPVQTFGSPADLAGHVAFVHAAPPELDDEGNDLGGSGAAVVSTEIPAARSKKG